jgi:hypothetical protein
MSSTWQLGIGLTIRWRLDGFEAEIMGFMLISEVDRTLQAILKYRGVNAHRALTRCFLYFFA